MNRKPLRIALVGYGKMGKTINELATKQNHQIVAKINSSNKTELEALDPTNCDIAIEFSTPQMAPQNLTLLAGKGINTVCGTTAWLEHYDSISNQFLESEAAFLYASNFSIGVNIFFELNRQLAKLMQGRANYNPSITEEHHIQKKDAPSGTAVSLVDDIIHHSDTKSKWSLTENDKQTIHINAIREGDIKGTHIIDYNSPVDTISIKHTAHSRIGFAQGAILAAEFLYQKKGIFTMSEVLGLSKQK